LKKPKPWEWIKFQRPVPKNHDKSGYLGR